MTEAMRSNAGKPEMDYLLTFVGGISSAFRDTPVCEGLAELGAWYREDDRISLTRAASMILGRLDPNWPSLMAEVCKFGERKYLRGNYLCGMSWSYALGSLLRHVNKKYNLGEKIDPESGIDHDGAIAWNTVYVCHMVYTNTGKDDRIRARAGLANPPAVPIEEAVRALSDPPAVPPDGSYAQIDAKHEVTIVKGRVDPATWQIGDHLTCINAKGTRGGLGEGPGYMIHRLDAAHVWIKENGGQWNRERFENTTANQRHLEFMNPSQVSK